MKFINRLDSNDDEVVIWSVKDGCERILAITMKSNLAIRVYTEDGGIMDLTLPKIKEGNNQFSRKCETKKMKPRKEREPKTTHDSWWKGC